MALTAWLPLFTVTIAAMGAVFAALRFNREDASAVVAQQSTVLADMKALNDELAEAAARIRTERDELLQRVTALGEQVADAAARIELLQEEIRELRADLRARVRFTDKMRAGDAPETLLDP